MTTPNDQFRDARLKIERAKHHIADLHSKVQILSVGSFHVLTVENNPQTGNDVLKIEIVQFSSSASEFALIIGDALHNLESALDHAINEVVFRPLKSYDDHTKFPFKSTRDKLVSSINGALIHRASVAVCNFIVDTVKPYDGGNSALLALNDLNNVDKHRLLLPVVHINVINGIRIKNGGHEEVFDQVISGGRRFVSHDLPGRDFKVTNKGTASILVLFDKGTVWEGKPILPTLSQVAEMVTGLVAGIEEVFFAESRRLEFIK
jgi:hypothetical protein